MPRKENVAGRVKDIISDLEDCIRLLELPILATPTSESRNALTDANIHLNAALEALKRFK